ncbi:hypothetical protein Hanom_Chr06g00526801 [Helianthus anomalus]
MAVQIAGIHQRNVRRRVEPQPRVNVSDFTVDLGGTRSSMVIPKLSSVMQYAILLPTF